MKNPASGYVLQSVYSTRLHFEGLPISEDLPQGDETQITIGWDWRIVAEHCFEVLVTLGIGPTKKRPEKVEAVMIGRFHFVGDKQSLGLLRFVSAGAPTILFPFVREAVSSLTSRGVAGSFQLNPVNMAELAKGFNQAGTTAARQLRENPGLADVFGNAEVLTLLPPALAAPAPQLVEAKTAAPDT